jgi:hypothetical protein
MASSSPMRERRRGERVRIRIPVQLFTDSWDGHPVRAAAEAIEVNRWGALLHTPIALGKGTTVEVMNTLSEEVNEFRVVRVAEEKTDGLFEVGIESLSPFRNFWGIQFPEPPVAA